LLAAVEARLKLLRVLALDAAPAFGTLGKGPAILAEGL